MGTFQRPKPGERLDFGGIDIVHPIDMLPNGKYPFAQNIRRYIKGAVKGRTLLTDAIFTLASAVHSICRSNDSTPNGPSSGFSIINGAGTTLYDWNSDIGVKMCATGLSGNTISMVPFRPNTSVQPWVYIGDASENVVIQASTFSCTGMLKVRAADALTYKMGIKEPQLAPVVSTENTTKTIQGILLATTIPWTNFTGANPSYNYGETEGYPNSIPPIDGTAPFIVDCNNASYITITSITGSATINGGVATPTTNGPATGVATNPGHYVMVAGTGLTPPATASVVIGAFTDGAGNVVPAGQAPLWVPSVVDVGGTIGTQITVPFGALQFQIGINSTGNTFTQGGSPNSGSFTINIDVTTNALPTVTSILGTLTLNYYPDSPITGPVSAYIWKNADDSGGSGPVRSTTNASGTTTGNSFIFDATFTAGIPALPGLGDPLLPMEWSQLTPQSVASGSVAVFQPALMGLDGNTAYQNFNFLLYGNIFVPAAGNYTFVLTNHDDVIWGIGGGAVLVSASAINAGGSVSTSISGQGQTITVANGYKLLPRGNYLGGGGGAFVTSTVVVHFANAGIYPIEIDYDYWYHSGRILLLMASPTPGATATIIPPLPINVRQLVQYRYVYRSSATGALSNPSPESAAETIPVTANTVTSFWSNDPQVDVVDYYRIDSVTASFTYVATGPNDNLGGGGTNTPITDSLLDTELGNQLLDYDNFEPFPSIDLPQKGVCSVSGGVITWVSGGAIGGTSTGFSPRWLAGTTILIGSPTSLPYVLIARPVANTITIPEVPDGSNLAYEISEPILAAQPMQYIWGPTDNINFAYGVGDPLRPGTLYWSKGSNLDSAPDTNQQDLTDPGEVLIDGAITGGLGVVFSDRRAWLIVPNFFNALATVTGTEGSTWSLQESSITRGLFMPRCLCVSGGGLVFFRVSDGIHISERGEASKSVTDEDLYPLFAHENEDGGTSVPQPVTVAGYTVYPPDDSQPQGQRFSIVDAYMYYDYLDTTSTPRTLVFDMAAMGWVIDSYTPPATTHASNVGESVQGVLVGCGDGTVRQLASGGTEVATAVLLTPAADKDDTRASAKWGDLYIETTSP